MLSCVAKWSLSGLLHGGAGQNGLHTKDDSDDVGAEEIVILSLTMKVINEKDKLEEDDKDCHDDQHHWFVMNMYH